MGRDPKGVWGLGWGGREKRSGEVPSERLRSASLGLSGAIAFLRIIKGKERPGVCLLPQCPIGVFSADSAVTFLPCKSIDPNSMSFRIINGTHLLMGTRYNYKIVFLRLRGLICYLLDRKSVV